MHRLTRVGAILRQVAGAPDYDGYLAHLRTRHPGAEPLERDEFYRARLEERYNKPGAKCC
ncbi:MAG: YbdD/YjiX family protein [Gemmatimonadota bacterium]|nr:YbdD/YjiX family protein [Gemmatimonadota bacterium]